MRNLLRKLLPLGRGGLGKLRRNIYFEFNNIVNFLVFLAKVLIENG
jgi:hypothetical protein